MNSNKDYESKEVPIKVDTRNEKPKKDEIEVKFSKKSLIITIIAALAIFLGIFFWKFDGYNKILTWIMPAQIETTVVDQLSQKPVKGAEVTIGGKSGTTNEQGVAEVKGLHWGNYTLETSASNYDVNKQTVKLNRGKNYIKINLTPYMEKITLSGIISDYINGNAIEQAEITTSFGDAKTNKDGKFTISNFPIGESTITFKKSGYNNKTQKITVEKNKTLELNLTPNGKAIFVSSRDEGKRAIYSADYDGTNINQLIKRVGDTEDYNALTSQDQSKVIFLSTRDKRKQENGPNYEPYLYFINSNGENLSLISKDFGIYGLSWSNNNKYFAWISRSAETGSSRYLLNVYNTSTKKSSLINENGVIGKYIFNHKGTAIAWYRYTGSDPNIDVGLFYVNLSSGDPIRVSEKISDMSFSNDDLTLDYSYYDSADQKNKYVKYNIASGNQSSYTPEPTSLIVKIASPDGKKYAYSSERDGKNDIYVSDTDGKNEKRITSMGTVHGNPIWDLTGNYILFDSIKTGETAKYIVGLTGKEAKKITDEYLENGQGPGM